LRTYFFENFKAVWGMQVILPAFYAVAGAKHRTIKWVSEDTDLRLSGIETMNVDAVPTV
jgi:hypothetical protein